ncbi:hypothetical protein [Streptantibioticus silvisoli]|uniref:PASTA domain-containing protein n=1 Tax=Streptantibioticus silvisoli TaxID=2705255 RepID=A0ABT6W243_9ACTN|nr:hypothetical protein [Streptantibioticus silvisoli]MDI5964812.1 hypothetical protein [Streptantibioticus silvisoli]
MSISRVLPSDNAEKATRLLEEDEKGTQIVGTPGGEQRLSVIYEDGMWELIFRSSNRGDIATNGPRPCGPPDRLCPRELIPGGTMRTRTIPAVAVLLLATAGCGPTVTHGHGPEKTAAAAPKAKPKPSAPAESCSPTRDVIVWTKEPGLAATAQVLGNYDIQTCQTTFASLPHSSPTEAGYCTEAAYASDNPGYNADATPAKRPEHVQVTVGPAC